MIDISVGVSSARRKALEAAGTAVPADVQCRFLIDTGATSTNICQSVLRQLALTPTGAVAVVTPSTGTTPVQMPTYDVRLGYPFPGFWGSVEPVQVICADFSTHGIHGLIGRDQLSRGLLVYHGDIKLYSLTF